MSRTSKIAARVSLTLSACVGLTLLAVPAGAEPGFSSVQPMPSPVASASPPVAPWGSVSCPTTTSCTAVGAYGLLGTGEGHPSAVTETSGVWGTPHGFTVPSGGAYRSNDIPAQLNQVSCFDATDCTAVGTYPAASGKSQFAMVASETAGTWAAATTSALPSNAYTAETYGTLQAVSCTGVGDCTAIGAYGGSDEAIHDFVITQSSGTWQTPTELPDIPGASGSDFAVPAAIACQDATDCTAIGYGLSLSTFAFMTYSWTETAGTWASPVVIRGPGSGASSAFLGQGLACPTATTCLAVGALGGLTSVEPAVATETAGTWATAHRLPIPRLAPSAFGGLLEGISCGSATTCEAVGGFPTTSKDTNAQAGAVTWSSGSWSSIGYVRGVRAGTVASNDSAFTSVSCPSATSCTGIGGGGLTPSKGNEPVYPFSADLTTVRPVSAPRSPTALTSTPLGGGAIVSWHPPIDDGGAPVTHFTVEVAGATRCTTAGERCALRGLVDGHRYRVSVTDTTSYASSAPLAELVTAGGLPGTVTHVHAASGQGLLAISWGRAITPPGEPVLRYEVTVSGPGGPRHCVTHARGCHVGGLTAHDTYSVTVTAVDANGAGPSSRPIRAVVG